MAQVKVAVINQSTVVDDDEVRTATAALQKQVHDHFCPAWGIDADLQFVPTGSAPPAGSWWLVILDNADQAGALGYHDITDEGLPLGKAFAGTDKRYGTEWTVTASHELLEMLGDPDINLTAFVEDSKTSGRLFAYEVADACEADEFGYVIDGVLVSDFVYPSWFESFWKPGSTQFDYCKKIQEPFELLPGGYIGEYDVKVGGGWTQVTAQTSQMKYAMRPSVGSRRERRRTPRSDWMRSKVSWKALQEKRLFQPEPVPV
jgi:hypothetical protein